MDHETARMDRFEQGVRAMSPQERDAMKAALKAIDALPPNCREMMLDRVTEIAAARGRARRAAQATELPTCAAGPW